MKIYAKNKNNEYEKIYSFSKLSGAYFAYLDDKGHTQTSDQVWQIKDDKNEQIQTLRFKNDEKIDTEKLMLILYQYKDKLKLTKYLKNKEDKLKLKAQNYDDKFILGGQEEIEISFKDLIKNQKNQKRKD